MTLISSGLTAVLFAGGAFLLMRRSNLDLILGTALLSTGTIVSILAAGSWAPDLSPPFIGDAEAHSAAHASLETARAPDGKTYADPLPHALILTALVIGFGFLSFLTALVSLGGKHEAGSGESAPAGRSPSE